jgi:hypothetical protein
MSRLQLFITVSVSDNLFSSILTECLNTVLVLATKNLIRLEQTAPYEPFLIAIN